MHVHTIYSADALTKLSYLKKLQQKTGLVYAITDHNSTAAHRRAKSMGIMFIPGEEITTNEGHLIALFIEEEIPPFISLEEALDKIREQGALSYAPHPFSLSRHGVGDKASLCDIVEVLNSHDGEWEDKKAMDKAKEWKKPVGGGSDAHLPFEVGRAYIEGDVDISSPKSFLKSLSKASPKIERRRSIMEWLIKRLSVASKSLREMRESD